MNISSTVRQILGFEFMGLHPLFSERDFYSISRLLSALTGLLNDPSGSEDMTGLAEALQRAGVDQEPTRVLPSKVYWACKIVSFLAY